MAKTKKVGSSGRFGVKAGSTVRAKLAHFEIKQRIKQICPFCNKAALKRTSKALWECKKCKKRFASHTYYIEKVNK
jgi:large subunit ribosomal protein L37Ae